MRSKLLSSLFLTFATNECGYLIPIPFLQYPAKYIRGLGVSSFNHTWFGSSFWHDVHFYWILIEFKEYPCTCVCAPHKKMVEWKSADDKLRHGKYIEGISYIHNDIGFPFVYISEPAGRPAPAKWKDGKKQSWTRNWHNVNIILVCIQRSQRNIDLIGRLEHGSSIYVRILYYMSLSPPTSPISPYIYPWWIVNLLVALVFACHRHIHFACNGQNEGSHPWINK